MRVGFARLFILSLGRQASLRRRRSGHRGHRNDEVLFSCVRRLSWPSASSLSTDSLPCFITVDKFRFVQRAGATEKLNWFPVGACTLLEMAVSREGTGLPLLYCFRCSFRKKKWIVKSARINSRFQCPSDCFFYEHGAAVWKSRPSCMKTIHDICPLILSNKTCMQTSCQKDDLIQSVQLAVKAAAEICSPSILF